MLKAGPTDDEENRLVNLRALSILDTPSEERFDRLTRLASRMFNVPIAIVSLVDENRQWFKSIIGLEVPETARDISFCGHAILGEGIFLVPDASKDSRFSDNPLVVGDPHIRFYAGCPLHSHDGSKLGTLCIIDRKPREFTDDELMALTDLAKLAENELVAVKLAMLDDLTLIANRRGFLSDAQNSLNLCKRLRVQATLLFLDIDKFKQINDSCGHAEGDKVLTTFAKAMTHTFRKSDVIARMGGDEFAVLLNSTSSDDTVQLLKRFRDAITAHNRGAKAGYDITFSYGVITIEHDQSLPLESLLSKADAAMYKTKQKRSEKSGISSEI